MVGWGLLYGIRDMIIFPSGVEAPREEILLFLVHFFTGPDNEFSDFEALGLKEVLLIAEALTFLALFMTSSL